MHKLVTTDKAFIDARLNYETKTKYKMRRNEYHNRIMTEYTDILDNCTAYCKSVHHKSHWEWPEIQPEPP